MLTPETQGAPALDLVRVTLAAVVAGLAANPHRIGLAPGSRAIPHLQRLGDALRELDLERSAEAFGAAMGTALVEAEVAAFDEEAAWSTLLDRMREELESFVARRVAERAAPAAEEVAGG